jgi:NIMA (never in mitosis gene a)-related kinase
MDILHRDLKSANIFINNNGDAKLGDLNVSKLAKMGLVFKFNNF